MRVPCLLFRGQSDYIDIFSKKLSNINFLNTNIWSNENIPDIVLSETLYLFLSV